MHLVTLLLALPTLVSLTSRPLPSRSVILSEPCSVFDLMLAEKSNEKLLARAAAAKYDTTRVGDAIVIIDRRLVDSNELAKSRVRALVGKTKFPFVFNMAQLPQTDREAFLKLVDGSPLGNINAMEHPDLKVGGQMFMKCTITKGSQSITTLLNFFEPPTNSSDTNNSWFHRAASVDVTQPDENDHVRRRQMSMGYRGPWLGSEDRDLLTSLAIKRLGELQTASNANDGKEARKLLAKLLSQSRVSNDGPGLDDGSKFSDLHPGIQEEIRKSFLSKTVGSQFASEGEANTFLSGATFQRTSCDVILFIDGDSHGAPYRAGFSLGSVSE